MLTQHPHRISLFHVLQRSLILFIVCDSIFERCLPSETSSISLAFSSSEFVLTFQWYYLSCYISSSSCYLPDVRVMLLKLSIARVRYALVVLPFWMFCSYDLPDPVTCSVRTIKDMFVNKKKIGLLSYLNGLQSPILWPRSAFALCHLTNYISRSKSCVKYIFICLCAFLPFHYNLSALLTIDLQQWFWNIQYMGYWPH